MIFKGHTALSIPFDNSGTSIRGTDADTVFKELRSQVVYDPSFVTTSLNGNTALTSASPTLNVVTGTATGHSITLPNATTLFNGGKYEFINASTQAITIKVFGGSLAATINAGDTATTTLRGNLTSDGIWTVVAISSIAAGVQAYNVTQSSTFSISSSTDTLITGMTYTPPSGTYGVWFSSDINIGANNRLAQCALYKAGTIIADSRRSQQGTGSNYKSVLPSLTIVSLNGSQSVDARASVDSGTLDLFGRSLLFIRLGA